MKSRKIRKNCFLSVSGTAKGVIILLSILFTLPLFGASGFIASLQGGALFTTYNDARLPGDSGSTISYVDDVDADTGFSPRIEAGYEFSFPLYVGLMASTLTTEGSGTLNRDITFDNRTFSKGTKVDGTYRFDSYRLTARYYFYSTNRLTIGAGLTGKIRSAEITLKGGGQEGSLTNIGAVPLLNLYVKAGITEPLSVLFYGDGAWSPYGRAEDYLAGLVYDIHSNLSLMAGYRILEGGADNDEVYTFSMFHYAVFGLEARI